MGRYDAPAMIDRVLNETREEKLYYVGFSMGTTIFFTMMHHHPHYNDKVGSAFAPKPFFFNSFPPPP